MKTRIKRNKMFLVSLFGILFIPILYAGFFINAFNDPYNNLEDVKVAIINEDEAIDCSGSEMDLGSMLTSGLKEKAAFDYEFVSNEVAVEGMKSNKYYFSIKIPSDFTSNICKTINGEYTESNIVYIKNDNANYISGILGNSLVTSLKTEVNSTISTQFLISLNRKLQVLKEIESGASMLKDVALTGQDTADIIKGGLTVLDSSLLSANTMIDSINLSENAMYITNPVGISNQSYSEVPNYGYGFAPYFIALGLFVGGISSTIVIGEKRKGKDRRNQILDTVKIYTIVALGQAVVLSGALLIFNLNIEQNLLFILFTMLVSFSFMALIQMLSLIFNDIGKFLCIVILILQLTSAGGTFPVETTPSLFNSLHSLMPMTYAVDGLRTIIGNGNMNIVLTSSIYLSILLVISMGTTISYIKLKKKKNK